MMTSTQQIQPNMSHSQECAKDVVHQPSQGRVKSTYQKQLRWNPKNDASKRLLLIPKPPARGELSQDEIKSWTTNMSRFFQTGSQNLLPTKGQDPLKFLVNYGGCKDVSHVDYLKRRIYYRFWQDYVDFTGQEKKPKEGKYQAIANILKVQPEDDIILKIKEWKCAGKRYAMMAEAFGEGILLTIPTSVSKSSLEQHLPVANKTHFDERTQPLVGSVYHQQAQTQDVATLARNIRFVLLKAAGVDIPIRDGQVSSHTYPSGRSESLNLIMDSSDSLIATRKRVHDQGQSFSASPKKPRISAPPQTNISKIFADEEPLELLKLFCVLDPDALYETMFFRATKPQRRWDCSGEIKQIPQNNIAALMEGERLESAINYLETQVLLLPPPKPKDNNELLSTNKYTIPECVRTLMQASDLRRSKIHAIAFISFVFPQIDTDSGFGDWGRLLLSQLQCALQHYQTLKDSIDSHQEHDLAGALIAASFVQDQSQPNWKHNAIQSAKNIIAAHTCKDHFQKEDVYLHIWACQREAFLDGRPDRLFKTVSPMDARSNAQLGQSLLIHARTFMDKEDFYSTKSLLVEFKAFGTVASNAESLVQQEIDILLANILRWQGRFHEALQHFHRLVDLLNFTLTQRGCILTSQYVEVLCETDKLAQAEDIARGAIESMKAANWIQFKRGRRLRRSLADILLRKGDYIEAEEIYMSLNKDTLQHSRNWRLHCLVSLSMIAHLQRNPKEARCRWQNVRGFVSDLNWKDFTFMVIWYAMCDINLSLGQVREGKEALREANRLFKQIGRKFWITSMGSFFLDHLKSSILSLLPGAEIAIG